VWPSVNGILHLLNRPRPPRVTWAAFCCVLEEVRRRQVMQGQATWAHIPLPSAKVVWYLEISFVCFPIGGFFLLHLFSCPAAFFSRLCCRLFEPSTGAPLCRAGGFSPPNSCCLCLLTAAPAGSSSLSLLDLSIVFSVGKSWLLSDLVCYPCRRCAFLVRCHCRCHLPHHTSLPLSTGCVAGCAVLCSVSSQTGVILPCPPSNSCLQSAFVTVTLAAAPSLLRSSST
jgi:hypothetical protein